MHQKKDRPEKLVRKLYAENGESRQYRIDRETIKVFAEAAQAATDRLNIQPSHALVIRRAVRVYRDLLLKGRVKLNPDQEPYELLRVARGLS